MRSRREATSGHLLQLVQARTLAASGVPLAEIGSLLDADATLFIAALADVERQLIERIEELIAQRDTLHRLAALTTRAAEAVAWEVCPGTSCTCQRAEHPCLSGTRAAPAE